MEYWNQTLKKIINLIGFDDVNIEIDTEHRKINIFIYNQSGDFESEHISSLIENLNKIIHIITQKRNEDPIHIDINNYRKEREKLIEDIAKASAKKAVTKHEEVELPPMNSYERRLIHVTLATHPKVETVSAGIGRSRHVVVKVLE